MYEVLWWLILATQTWDTLHFNYMIVLHCVTTNILFSWSGLSSWTGQCSPLDTIRPGSCHQTNKSGGFRDQCVNINSGVRGRIGMIAFIVLMNKFSRISLRYNARELFARSQNSPGKKIKLVAMSVMSDNHRDRRRAEMQPETVTARWAGRILR